jgi:WD40 repeat protein
VSEYKRDAGPSDGLAFGPDGESVVRLSHDHVLVWKPGESEARKLPLAQRPVRSRALSPDGRFVAESSEEGIELSSIDFAASQLKPVMMLPNRNGKSGKAWCLAFSQDGRRLAAGFWDGTLRIYELNVGRIANPSYKVAHEYKLTTTLTHMAISADGAHLATFNGKDGIVLIDTATGERHSLWSSAGANVVSLRFSPDGRWLMAGCSDRTARLWSVADIRPLLVIDADHLSWGMVWMPERQWLVTADGSVKVWAVETPIPKHQTNTSQ